LADDHFTFLGYRDYKLSQRGKKVFLNPVKDSGLGLLSRQERGGRAIELSDEMRRLTRSRDWLILTKANSRSTIHRHAYLDYIRSAIVEDIKYPVCPSKIRKSTCDKWNKCLTVFLF